ncbi:MAG: hypothetical protein LBV12_05900 [Puniceicoccales bacterium]|jgi:hypothetical protein|nr:hypothetical protein [Puniceicoccales bacterium]
MMEEFPGVVPKKHKKAPAWEVGLYAALCVCAGFTAYILYQKTPQRPNLDDIEVVQTKEKAPPKTKTDSLRDRLR